ncbi:MAG: hypothetical protein ABI859_04110 [Pseudomonadota bacterium]
MKQWEERLRAVAERAFPRGTRLIAPPGKGDYVLLASWKVGADPARRRGKTVRITIATVALETYGKAREGERHIADQRFNSFLFTQLSRFDPSHDTPLGTEPPIVTWAVDDRVLNGDR